MSDLLNKASLVMVPSGYKEDTVYSVVPSDGSGDLAFTRASNGTRINSAGLVEVVPWNLLSYSNDLSNSYWTKRGFAQIATNATAPDGSATAYKIQENDTDDNPGLVIIDSVTPSGTNTFFVWLKGDGNYSFELSTNGAVGGGTINVTTSWQLFSVTQTNVPYNGPHIGGFLTIARNSGIVLYVWHPQLNIGSTAKPYFPTTDRLNVPRLTYQNGGGGCPSLLLEKQSTNLVTYSEQFDNVLWDNAGGAVVVANNAISPDGTQNADKATFGASSLILRQLVTGITNGVAYTLTAYVKKSASSPASNVRLTVNNTATWSGAGSTKLTLTDSWQRITLNWTSNGTSLYFIIGAVDENGNSDSSCYGNVDVWGAQLEASSYPTSYIPTTSSSATRVADVCSKTGISSLIGQTSGSVFFDFTVDTISGQTNDPVLWYMKDGGSGERYVELFSNGNLLYIEYDGSTIIANMTKTGLTVGRHKCAIAYAPNDMAFYVDGVQIGTDTSGTPSGLSTFGFQYYNSAFNGQQQINQAILFPTRLSNAELASLTTI